MPHCTHCEAFVTPEFVRVFANGDGEVRACPNCSANAGIAATLKRRRAGNA
jgi:hypothetical protein